MTLSEFLKELEKTPRTGWYITMGGHIRRRYKNRCYCPITAVVHKKCRVFIDEIDACLAGVEYLKMSCCDVDYIILSADIEVSPTLQVMRNKILKGIGLNP